MTWLGSCPRHHAGGRRLRRLASSFSQRAASLLPPSIGRKLQPSLLIFRAGPRAPRANRTARRRLFGATGVRVASVWRARRVRRARAARAARAARRRACSSRRAPSHSASGLGSPSLAVRVCAARSRGPPAARRGARRRLSRTAAPTDSIAAREGAPRTAAPAVALGGARRTALCGPAGDAPPPAPDTTRATAQRPRPPAAR
jgi:hypothetical protein